MCVDNERWLGCYETFEAQAEWLLGEVGTPEEWQAHRQWWAEYRAAAERAREADANV